MSNKSKKISKGIYDYKGYELRYFGYHQPDHSVYWEAVNKITHNTDYHAHTKKGLIQLIDKYEGDNKNED